MHPILVALKPVAQALIMRKVKKEITREIKTIANSDSETIKLVDTIETAVISKKKASAWATVVIALSYFASSQGYIDSSLADLINTILSNPEIVEGIEEAVSP